jgi:hypothetical protein
MANVFDLALQQEGVTGPLAELARSIYMQESGAGKNTATSNAGAVGGMQIIPDTFARMADKGWDINDPLHNARAGIRYLSKLHDITGGDPQLTAVGYYGGEGAIPKAKQGIPVYDPRNPNAPNTLQYGQQVANRLASATMSDANPPSLKNNDPLSQLDKEFAISNYQINENKQAHPLDVLDKEFAIPKSVSQEKAEERPQTSFWDQTVANISALPRQAGLTGRYALEGAGDIGSMLLSPVQVPMSMASQAMGGAPVANMRQMATKLADVLRLPTPQNKSEEIVGDITRGMVGGMTGAGVAGSLAQKAAPLLNLRSAIPGVAATELAATPVATTAAPTMTQQVASQMAANPTLQAVTGGVASGAGSALEKAGAPVATQVGGSLLSSLVPGAASGVASKGYQLAKAGVQPLYEGGRNQILANTLRNLLPDEQVGPIVERLETATPLLTGSNPTAAEVANSGGIAALQRAAAQAFPEPYTQRGLEQSSARVGALRNIAQDEQALAAAETARKVASQPLYTAAASSTNQVDPTRVVRLIDRIAESNPANKALINSLNDIREGLFQPYTAEQRGADAWKELNTALTKRMSDADSNAVKQARTVMDRVKKGSIDANEGLAQLKGLSATSKTGTEALDYAVAQLKTPDYVLRDNPKHIISSIDNIKTLLANQENSYVKRELLTVKKALEHQLGKATPEFKQAEQTFAQMSRPINQMAIGQELLNKMQPALADYGALGSETAARYANALRNANQTAKTATGFKGATLENTMNPEQLQTLDAIAQDLARKANAQNLGRGVGSNTYQNLAMQNMAHQAGLPMGLLELPVVGRGMNWLYKNADEKMQEALAKALLNPQETAALIRSAKPANRETIADILRNMTRGGAVGSSVQFPPGYTP